jgi:hypothetical protein
MEELMPTLQQLLLVLFDKSQKAVDLSPRKAVTAFQQDGVEPELGFALLALYMDVGRFISITRVEEQPVRPGPKNRGHVLQLPS